MRSDAFPSPEASMHHHGYRTPYCTITLCCGAFTSIMGSPSSTIWLMITEGGEPSTDANTSGTRFLGQTKMAHGALSKRTNR